MKRPRSIFRYLGLMMLGVSSGAWAQPSPEVANQLSSRCKPTASTVISTSASPMERHRIERIGGDNICESALAAASIMVNYPLNWHRTGRQDSRSRQGLKNAAG